MVLHHIWKLPAGVGLTNNWSNSSCVFIPATFLAGHVVDQPASMEEFVTFARWLGEMTSSLYLKFLLH